MAESWEYLVVFISDTDFTEDHDMDKHLDADKFTEQLNKYGSAGWELVNFTWEGNAGAKAAFKRKKQ